MALFSKEKTAKKDGISGVVSTYVANMLETVHLRGKLASLEARELANYWKIVALLVGIAAGAAFTTFLLINALILVIFQRHLVAATAIMLGVYVVVTVSLASVIVMMSKSAPAPFADTLEEIRKDADMLSGDPDHE